MSTQLFGPTGEPIFSGDPASSHSESLPRGSSSSPGPAPTAPGYEPGKDDDVSYQGQELTDDGLVIYWVGGRWKAYDSLGGLVAETPTQELLNRRLFDFRFKVAKEIRRQEMLDRAEEKACRRRGLPTNAI